MITVYVIILYDGNYCHRSFTPDHTINCTEYGHSVYTIRTYVRMYFGMHFSCMTSHQNNRPCRFLVPH